VFGEAPPFSIEALRAKMDDLLAWTDKLCVELDTRAAHQYLQVERLVSANRELSVQFDLLQAKFDHFINEHWQPMQHSLGTRTQIPTRHMLDTLGVQTTSDSNVPSGQKLGLLKIYP